MPWTLISTLTVLVSSFGLSNLLQAAPQADVAVVGDSEVKDALHRGYEIIRKGVKNYPEHRDCFSCHHQALPIVAFSLDGRKSLEVDSTEFYQSEVTQAILKFTEESFAPKKALMREGSGVGGRALTAAYGLWTLDVGRAPRSETIDAMVEYLLKTQAEDGAWEFQSHRPPAAASRMMTTAIAVYGLRAFGFEQSQKPRTEEALRKAAAFAEKHPLDGSHEELIGALWLDQMLVNEPATSAELLKTRLSTRTNELSQRQQPDGGWAQTAEMSSDAYATGQALLMLAQLDNSGKVHERDSFKQGIRFLLKNQQTDGSWHVVTRAKPVQVYFDNGDPHGKDQFISMMATCWSTAALANFQASGSLPLESVQVALRKAE
ncbi:MAG: prenyltransferase/squalene oxidase repeat-containing protein [Pirellulaceae bacterium]|nr:prenyltransferase/squalene oxidase repeat-containing protein [Pirellulaceae bacterium]